MTERKQPQGEQCVGEGRGAIIQIELTVVLYQEGTHWLAHGLQNDLVTQADTLEGAKDAFEDALRTLFAYHLSQGTLPKLRPAPPEIWAAAMSACEQRIEDVAPDVPYSKLFNRLNTFRVPGGEASALQI